MTRPRTTTSPQNKGPRGRPGKEEASDGWSGERVREGEIRMVSPDLKIFNLRVVMFFEGMKTSESI